MPAALTGQRPYDDDRSLAIDLQGDAAGFVAGGTDWFSTSPDGRIWTQPHNLDEGCATLYRVPSGFVRYSGGPDCDRDQSAILTSGDGTTWRPRGFVEARWDDIELLPAGFLMRRWVDDSDEGTGISGAGWLAYSYSRDGVTWSDLGQVPGENRLVRCTGQPYPIRVR